MFQIHKGVELTSKKRTASCLLGILILLVFFAVIFATRKIAHRQRPLTTVLSNGTHTFGPTTILISLDGFRADFLNRNLTPALNAFIASGVSPRYMLPSFPSLTFPNHFTLVTGLYPESHGIVANQFWDVNFQEEFYYTDTEISMQSKWWNAEPIWVTAEREGIKTAIHMWPGSEAHIPDIEPTYLDKFNKSEGLERKVDRVLNWIDLEDDQRPQFIAAYVPNVDTDGHRYGPNSTEIRSTIANVDSMLTLLTEGLYERNLTELVNLIVVSDHGMATTSTSRLIQLDDLIDLSLIDHKDGWPLTGLRLKNPDRDLKPMYDKLIAAAANSGSFEIYTRETMPDRYHFTNNDRIAPLWIVPKAGWAVVPKAEFDIQEAELTGRQYQPMGLHGYDHEHPLMRAIFIARGPAFPHTPNSRVPVFQNIEVYNIICDSLGINPHPNNGTLRLPFKPEGLHNDLDALPLPIPDDPGKPETTSIDITEPEPDHEIVPPANDKDDHKKTFEGFFKYIHDKFQKAKQWAGELIDSIKGNKHGSSGSNT